MSSRGSATIHQLVACYGEGHGLLSWLPPKLTASSEILCGEEDVVGAVRAIPEGVSSANAVDDRGEVALRLPQVAALLRQKDRHEEERGSLRGKAEVDYR